MCIYNINGIDSEKQKLEDKIRKAIVIPEELKKYLYFSTTSLGGLFLNYDSNGGIGTYRENSKARFSIFINVENRFGEYVGDLVTLEVNKDRRFFKGTGIRKPVSSDKAIAKLKKFLCNNMQAMLSHKGESI